MKKTATAEKPAVKKVPRYTLKLAQDGFAEAEVKGNSEAAAFAWSLLHDEPQEKLIALYIGADQTSVIGVETIASGTFDHVDTNIGNALRGALIAGAWGLVLAHNHPGEHGMKPTPSGPDKRTTRQVGILCGLLGLQLLDSFVVGHTPGSWTSIVETLAGENDTFAYAGPRDSLEDLIRKLGKLGELR